jgi:hypothetical protein
MSQIFDPVPATRTDCLLCCYVNVTDKIQVARITNVPSWYFERVVFPGQRLVFEAVREAQLEIHTGMMASAILSDTIACERLILQEGNNNYLPTSTQQLLEVMNEGVLAPNSMMATATPD